MPQVGQECWMRPTPMYRTTLEGITTTRTSLFLTPLTWLGVAITPRVACITPVPSPPITATVPPGREEEGQGTVGGKLTGQVGGSGQFGFLEGRLGNPRTPSRTPKLHMHANA